MEKTNYFIQGEDARCAHNYHPLGVVLERGEGIWLWDVEGKKYLDMMSAYSAVSHGHCHPALIETLKQQASTLNITSRAFHTDKLFPFLDKLCTMTGLNMALPMNTGAEAVETAIKAVRRWGYRHKKIPKDKAEIIVAQDNFHGRTLTITSFSTDEAYKADYGPFTPGFKAIAYNDVEALEKAITPNTCAFLVEPMQGESGIQIPSAGWLKKVSKICKDNQVLLVLDDIQTGLGRTGKMFAFEHEGIQPDALLLGKALGGGIFPVSAFLANQEVMQVFEPGSHGSTFGGNPLACAIALRALELLESENLADNSAQLGDFMLNALKEFHSPLIKDVRGCGLWIGLEIDTTKISARAVCESLMEEGILTKEAHDTVIRLAPPLIISQDECRWALDKIMSAFHKIK